MNDSTITIAYISKNSSIFTIIYPNSDSMRATYRVIEY